MRGPCGKRWSRTGAGFELAIGLAMILGACAHSSGGPTAAPTTSSPPVSSTAASTTPSRTPAQSPVPAESNPPGDIPDTTVYIPYTSKAGGFTIKTPEGWARRSTANGVTFSSALNSIGVTWSASPKAPTVASVKSTVVPSLASSTLAFQLQSVSQVSLPGGSAIEVVYQVNSPPNLVTGKQYRLVIEHFDLYKSGRLGVLSLSSAVGSDNVDPWRTVSESFAWS